MIAKKFRFKVYGKDNEILESWPLTITSESRDTMLDDMVNFLKEYLLEYQDCQHLMLFSKNGRDETRAIVLEAKDS